MSDLSDFVVPTPKGEKHFQKICLALVQREWRDNFAQLRGRRGTRQNGVDISGSDNRAGGARIGMQCKGSETDKPRRLKPSEIVDEVNAALTMSPPLKTLIIAVAGDKDPKQQDQVRAISEDHGRRGLFRVEIWFWDDIRDRLNDHADLEDKFLRPSASKGAGPAVAIEPRRPGHEASAVTPPATSAMASFAALIPKIEEEQKAAVEDAQANAKIDLLRDQVNEGAVSAAMPMLEKLAAGITSATSKRIRFRIFAIMGSALGHLGRSEEATTWWDKAAAEEGETADGHLYRARAAHVRGQYEISFAEAGKALALRPADTAAGAIRVSSAPRDYPVEELRSEVAASYGAFDVNWGLARFLRDKQDYAAALEVMSELKDDEPEWKRRMVTGEVILAQYEGSVEARMGSLLSPEAVEHIQRARDDLAFAWEEASKRSDSRSWVHIVANLGVAHRLLDEDEDANKRSLEAYALAPDERNIAVRAALALGKAGDWVAAYEIVKKITTGEDPQNYLFAAHVACSAKLWDEADIWAAKALAALSGKDRGRAAEVSLVVTEEKHGHAAALAAAKKLRKSLGGHIAFEARVAELARRAGDEKALQEAMAILGSFVPDTLDIVERFELADAYGDAQQWSKAADILAGMHSNDRESEILRRRLYALYRADRRADARALLASLKPEALSSIKIIELAAAIYARSGMLEEAEEQLSRALEMEPKDLRTRLDWLNLLFRSDQKRKAAAWLKVAPIDLKGSVEDRLEFARHLDRHKRREDALALAYTALRDHWGESERAHMLYVSLFFLRQEKTPVEPKQVAIDTWVKLEGPSGQFREYTIEAGGARFGTLPPDHDISQLLMGLKAGHTITLPKGIGEAVELTIREIKHKYVSLLQRSLADHEILFPGSKALTQFRIDLEDPNKFEPIFERARAREKLGHEITEAYRSGPPIPIEFVGKALGADVFDAAAGLRWEADQILDTCHGSSDEREAAQRSVASEHRILIDALTLGLWEEIGLLDRIPMFRGLKVVIVQATLDAILQKVEDTRSAVGQKGGVMRARGEKMQLRENSRPQQKALADRWQAILHKVKGSVEIIPTEAWGEPKPDSVVTEFLTASTSATLATAQVTGIALVCEDRRIRDLAREWKVAKLSWTQPFLIALKERQLLSSNDYLVLASRLHRQRIGFVSVAESDLTSAIAVGDTVTYGLWAEVLINRLADAKSVAMVVAKVLHFGLHAAGLDDTGNKWTDTLLSALLKSGRTDTIALFGTVERVVGRALQQAGDDEGVAEWRRYTQRFRMKHFLPLR